MIETLPDRFCWTHRHDHGPDERLLRLRPGHTVLDLGCGRGTHLAYLSRTHHIHGIGLDHEAEWPSGVCTYAHGGTAEFLHTTALDYLNQQPENSINAIYSRFGAIWFTDPQRLLSEVFPLERTLDYAAVRVSLANSSSCSSGVR